MPALRKARRVVLDNPNESRAAHLPVTDRLTDLLIDITVEEGGGRLSPRQFRQLSALAAEAHQQAAAGALPTVRWRSRIWDEPVEKPRYGDDDPQNAIPVVYTRRVTRPRGWKNLCPAY